MAQIVVDDIVDHLSSEFKKALRRTLEKEMIGENNDINQIYRIFLKEIRRACNSTERVPDNYIR